MKRSTEVTFSFSAGLEFARFCVQEPRQAARKVIAADLPMPVRWMGLVLAAIVSAITVHLYLGLFPADAAGDAAFPGITPFTTVLLDLVFNLAAAVLLFAVGRWRGGQGSFADSLILIVVLQLILILPQLLQLVAIVLVPPLASIIGLASVALYFWLISHFGAELHGFASALRVFFGVIATMVAVVFLLAFLMLPFVGAGV